MVEVRRNELDFTKKIKGFSILAAITDFLDEIEILLDFARDFKI